MNKFNFNIKYHTEKLQEVIQQEIGLQQYNYKQNLGKLSLEQIEAHDERIKGLFTSLDNIEQLEKSLLIQTEKTK